MSAEKFVDAAVAADHLGVTRRRVLDMARAGMIRCYPFSNGKRLDRHFKLNEIDEDMAKLAVSARKLNGSPFTPRRESVWRRKP